MAGHYLREELHRRLQGDGKVFDFIEQGSLDGVWYWDIEKPEHEWYSDRFCTLLGFAPEDVPPLSSFWQNQVHPDDLPRVLEMFERHVADPVANPYDATVRYRHRDGSTVWVRCRGLLIRDAAGKPSRLLGTHSDVTEVKRLEARLRDRARVAETLFETVYQNSPDMYVSVDPQTAAIKLCNATLLTKTGYLESEIIGRPVFELYDPSCLPDVERAFQSFVKTGVVDNAELVLRTKSGATIPVLLSVQSVRAADGEILQSISTWRDVSHLREVESLENLAANLRQSNADLSSFAHMASHDLQQPLRTVAGYCEVLEEEYGDRLDEQGRALLRTAVDAAKRMQVLVQELLQLSRVQAGGLLRAPVELGDVARLVMESLGRQIEASGAVVEISTLPTVAGDASQLQMLLQNLIGNAIKFGAPTDPRVRIDATRDQGGWVVSVSDNGIGIEPQFHTRIFEPFERAHAKRLDGSGVGLAIVARVAERHGGRAWVESALGEGSTFYVSLPDPDPDPDSA